MTAIILALLLAAQPILPKGTDTTEVLRTYGRPAARIGFPGLGGEDWVYRGSPLCAKDKTTCVLEFDKNGKLFDWVNVNPLLVK